VAAIIGRCDPTKGSYGTDKYFIRPLLGTNPGAAGAVGPKERLGDIAEPDVGLGDAAIDPAIRSLTGPVGRNSRPLASPFP
jgi:hypothetical protein